MKKQNITMFIWGMVAGGIGLAIVLFATGFAVTGSTAEQQARMAAQTAVAESLAKICVAQFEMAPDKAEKLVELKKLSSWERSGFVRDQGWATMPGSDSGSGPVATECALLLNKTAG